MDKTTFNGNMPSQQNRPKAFIDCAESVYIEKDVKKIAILSAGGKDGLDYATEDWYNKGNALIDYKTGKSVQNNSESKDLVDKLLHLIWKTTTKVAFGVKD
jgi:hypothetical protein